MSAQSVLSVVLASICGYVGCVHLLVFVRRPGQRTNLSFAIVCLLAGVYNVAAALVSGSGDPLRSRPWQIVQACSLLLGAAHLLLFVLDYLEIRPGRAARAFCFGAYGLSLFSLAAAERPWLFTFAPCLRTVSLPGFGEVRYAEVAAGPLMLFFWVSALVACLWIFWQCYRDVGQQRGRRSLPLLLAMGILSLGGANDAAIGFLQVDSVYLIPVAFLPLILLMTDALSRVALRADELAVSLQESEELCDSSERSRKMAEEQRDQLVAQLHHSQKMDALGRMASGVVHDLSNLLSPILGYSQILLGSVPKEDRIYPMLEEIHKSGERSRHLLQQLLTFGRKQAPELGVTSLSEVVEGMRRMLRLVLWGNIRLDLEVRPVVWPVLGDAHQIEHLLLNLVLNARDAMPQGGSLTLSLGNLELGVSENSYPDSLSPGCYVKLAVTDTGSGIPPQVLQRIFEPFFTTKEPGKGTGLGLSIVYGIVQQHKAKIRVVTQPGWGTSFQVLFPRHQATSSIVVLNRVIEGERLRAREPYGAKPEAGGAVMSRGATG